MFKSLAKNLLVIACLAVALTSVSFGAVKLRVVDANAKMLRVEYKVDLNVSTYDSKKFFTFPEDGFTFADDSISVISVRNLTQKEDLRWSLVPAKNDPNSKMLQVSYQLPSESEGSRKYEIEMIVEAKSRNIESMDDGALSVRYQSSHEMTFVVPSGFSLVGTSDQSS